MSGICTKLNKALLGIAVVLCSACMTSSFALNVAEDTGRFALNDSRLGQNTAQVLTVAQRQLGQVPTCQAEKKGNLRNKKASLVQVCRFDTPVDVYLARQKILEVVYHFVDGELHQIDVEIDASNAEGTARTELESAISVSLGRKAKNQGPVVSWEGESDAALLVRQGNFRLRLLSRLSLPETQDYGRIIPKQRIHIGS